MKDRHFVAYIFIAAIISLALVVAGLQLVTPVQAATPPVLENCEEAASAEGESLYLCDVLGVQCVWDPSPAMRSGLLSCDW